jgi:hypothetical protein
MKTPSLKQFLKADEPAEPYYRDQTKIDQFYRDQQQVIGAANALLKTFESSTGYRIESVQQLIALANDPQKVIHDAHMKAKGQEFEKFVAAGLDVAINYQRITNGKLPLIKSEAKRFSDLMVKSRIDYLELTKDGIQLSEFAKDSIQKRASIYASTDDEKYRLDLCRRFIALYSELSNHLQKSLKPSQFAEIKRHLIYARPMPYFLRPIAGQNGEPELGALPKFVSEGFNGQQGFPPDRRTRELAERDSRPRLGVPHLKAKVKLASGETRYFLVEKKDEEKYRERWGAAAEWLPGEWNAQDKKFGTPLLDTVATPETRIEEYRTETFLQN